MTEGLSPKVALPTLVLALIGTALTIVGSLQGNSELLSAGLAALGSSGLGGLIGFHAPPGNVDSGMPQPVIGSDELLPADAKAAIHSTDPDSEVPGAA